MHAILYSPASPPNTPCLTLPRPTRAPCMHRCGHGACVQRVPVRVMGRRHECGGLSPDLKVTLALHARALIRALTLARTLARARTRTRRHECRGLLLCDHTMAALLARPPVRGPRPRGVDRMRRGGHAAAAAQKGLACRAEHAAAGVLACAAGEAAWDGVGARSPPRALRKSARPPPRGGQAV